MLNFKKILKLIHNPNWIIFELGWHGCFKWMPDEKYLKMMYKSRFGKTLNLKNPQTFNEKLQWLKIHDRKDIYTTMVDKYAVKKYVADIIGEEYIIPTLGVWNHFDEIDFDKLPNQFVLKCTHDSGGLVIVSDKSKFDKKTAKKKLERSLKKNYYYGGREWPYKNVKPRIIAEKYMEDNKESIIKDYKWFCFNGEPKFMYISNDGAEHSTTDFFDMEFNHLPFRFKDPNANVLPTRPNKFEEMMLLAKKLSKNIYHVRVDFYLIDNKIYFGELTFYHNSGFGNISPREWSYKIGNMIKLPNFDEIN